MEYNREKVLEFVSNMLGMSEDCPGEYGLGTPKKCAWGGGLTQCKECWRNALEPILAPSKEETK